jgi:ketosteroid isomerase-like protein
MEKIKIMFRIIGVVLPMFLFTFVEAQQADGTASKVDDLNRALDRAVVKKDLPFLEKHYGDDFVFTHGTGHVDSKESWLKGVQQGNFISREHDSTKVELHKTIAIVTGKLAVQRKPKEGQASLYILKYVRVYALRKKVWQLISHRTVWEKDL